MIPQLSRNSRTPATLLVPANTTGAATLHVGGDFFYIYSMGGALNISVNGDAYAPCQSGLIHEGVVGRNDVSDIAFQNTTGADITVVVIFGKGSMTVTGLVNLSPGDISTITPPAAVLQAGFANLSNQAAVAYNGKSSISITNTGAVNILVNGTALLPEQTVAFTCERTQDTLPNFSVDTNTTPNGAALVGWTSA